MPRTIRNPKIDSRSARTKLVKRAEPYWATISLGCAIGYRRGSKGGTWVARFRDQDGRQHYEAIGAADDIRDADNVTAFSFPQAQAAARAFFDIKVREHSGDFIASDRPLTVADAVTFYQEIYVRRGGKAVGRLKSVARTYILPELGALPVSKLTKIRLEKWHESIANSRAHVRTRTGVPARFRTSLETPESKRQRRSTANRVLTILKAALNYAHQEGRLANNEAWARVKSYRNVESARMRYLSDEESRLLIENCNEEFRTLVVAALLTGCRYGELSAFLVEDFDSSAGTVRVRVSKSGKPRYVVLTKEGQDFFGGQCADKPRQALLLPKAGPKRWLASDQQRPMAQACAAAKIEPITFHGLRHTYASRLAMKGVPLTVIAAQLGHADVRMVEKHYGHLAPNYIAETVRAAFGVLGIASLNVVAETSKHSPDAQKVSCASSLIQDQ